MGLTPRWSSQLESRWAAAADSDGAWGSVMGTPGNWECDKRNKCLKGTDQVSALTQGKSLKITRCPSNEGR